MVKKLLFISLIATLVFGFDFKVSELVKEPGDNQNFDIIQDESYSSPANICWENQNGNIYTIFFRELKVDNSENIVIYQDTLPCITPQITINRSAFGVKILWQAKVNNVWKIMYRNFHNDSLGQVVIFVDSLEKQTEMSLSIHNLAYTDNNKLILKTFYEQSFLYPDSYVVDRGICKNPDIMFSDGFECAGVTYEKKVDGFNTIFLSRSTYDWQTKEFSWTITRISCEEETDCKNPKFYTYQSSIIYEIKIDDIWKIKTSAYSYLSRNKKCNFNNPDYYYYLMVTKANSESTPFFLVFDSDSLGVNKDIFIEEKNFGERGKIFNLSNSDGIDEKPRVTVFGDSLTIIWEHTENGKTDLWWARDINNPNYGAIEDENGITVGDFRLMDNFPNPFNPSTIISFEILESRGRIVNINIYNIQGNLVRNLSKSIGDIGQYSVFWDGKTDNGISLPSGEYIYNIEYNDVMKTGKMCLVK